MPELVVDDEEGTASEVAGILEEPSSQSALDFSVGGTANDAQVSCTFSYLPEHGLLQAGQHR